MQSFHFLKTWPRPFIDVQEGVKTFEYRVDDRGFEVGDILVLEYYDPRLTQHGEENGYSCSTAGNKMSVRRRITHIQSGGQFGVPAGYCIMSLELV